MWRRLMRRTFAPGRPPLFMEQWGLALATAIMVLAGIGWLTGLLR
jgi:hypothetical protein